MSNEKLQEEKPPTLVMEGEACRYAPNEDFVVNNAYVGAEIEDHARLHGKLWRYWDEDNQRYFSCGKVRITVEWL